MKTILIDPSKCIECHNCNLVCKDEHCDNNWSPIAAPQDPGQSWIRIESKEASSGSCVKMQHLPIMCQHCENAQCISQCPAGAIYRRTDGVVIIDPTKCDGCDICLSACSYGMIFKNTERNIAQKCTLCAHLLDEGWAKPRCVTACPTDALLYVDVEEVTTENLEGPLELLHPVDDDKPLIKYVKLPKPFVGGSVVIAQTGEPIRGVKVVAKHQVTGFTIKTRTDVFGDFNLDSLEPGFYTVSFDCENYDYKVIKSIDLRTAKNMGAVALRSFV